MFPLLLCAACGGGDSAPAMPVRLADHFVAAATAAPPAAAKAALVWEFNFGSVGWQPVQDLSGFAVRDHAMVASSSGPAPLLAVRVNPPQRRADLVQAIEVRMQVSAGADLRVFHAEDPSFDPVALFAQQATAAFVMRSPLLPGERTHTYRIEPPVPIRGERLCGLVLAPTDAAGAALRIESVRVIWRSEHLAAVPSGVSWQGLGEIYRETIVARAGEDVVVPVELPPRPWLDLAVGTLVPGTGTFSVAFRTGAGARERVLAAESVGAPGTWQPLGIDLSDLGSARGELVLRFASRGENAIGLWGSPVIRTAREEPREIVVMVVADTLRADHLDAYGYARETAPFLAKMAREGALFRDCVAQATWTKASVPSILASMWPTSHGVARIPDRLPDAAATIAEGYRDAGYATLAFSSVMFTGKLTNLQQGFEELHEVASLQHSPPAKTADEYVDRLIEWLDRRRGGPAFVFLHVFDPHDPYEPAAEWAGTWADPARRAAHLAAQQAVRAHIEEPLRRRFVMPTRQELLAAGLDPETFVGHDRDWYDGSIRGMDAALERLHAALAACGLATSTTIALVADHGEEFLDHGRTFHGQGVYGELAQVPLLLWRPGQVPAGSVIDATVRTIDLAPTLLDLSGIPAPARMQGRSLLPLLRGARGWVEFPAVVEKARTPGDVLAPPPQDAAAVAIVFEGWKLVRHLNGAAGGPEFELFDHRTDLLDQHDLAAENPAVVERLSLMLRAWRDQALAERLRPDGAGDDAVMSAAELELLRELGYVY